MGRPLQINSHLVQTRLYQTSISWTEKILKCQFMQIIRFCLEYLWRCQNVVSFFDFFLLFLLYIFFRFFLYSIAFSWFIEHWKVCAWFNFTCYRPIPGNPRDKSSHSGPGVGGPLPRAGGWGKQKIYFFWFCEVRVISRAVYTMATNLKTTYF